MSCNLNSSWNGTDNLINSGGVQLVLYGPNGLGSQICIS